LDAPPSQAPADEQPESDSDAGKQQRQERLITMRQHAKQFEVVRQAGDERQRVELRDDPLFRYSDQPRGFVDSTLWCWKAEGRPALLAKVEMGVTADRVPYWMHCVASLDESRVSVQLGNFRLLRTTKPGFELRKIPASPAPEDKPVSRLRQMKEMVGRFAATIHARHAATQELIPQEMRRLPSPIHRYADEGAGIVDGIIFALTTNGTNPDILIVIELRSAKGSPPEWMYGIVNMTAADVHLRLDDAEVWVSLTTDPRETWNYLRTERAE
jgi:hypothetical protein